MSERKAFALKDLSSLSNPEEIVIRHLDWKARVDFEQSILSCEATFVLDHVTPTSSTLCLDTAHLAINSVKVAGKDVPYKLHPVKKTHLGRKLEIKVGTADKVSIVYKTTTSSTALQWLPPSQTAGKKYPYLFTQCQAIHARSLLPCQDRPGVKMTYKATVTAPLWASCVMSGLLRSESLVGVDRTSTWEQPVPISSYLVALAVGDLEKIDLSSRCAIWSEPSVVKAAAYEFANTEQFLKTAEEITGMPYKWTRYDLLCLPPSFPYGGMENPCLTFVTPTLLAGDRSLADVVAHEISHSWTGNLVTNATWEHFWLNEGWTTWLQRKIMSRMDKDADPRQILDLDAISGYKTLKETVAQMPAKFTCLVPALGDLDPDECYSSVPYEKGFNLLYSLENQVGTEAFEVFFQEYLKQFENKTVTSDEFKDCFLTHFRNKKAEPMSFDWNAWLNSPGMPPSEPVFDRTLAEDAQNLAMDWIKVETESTLPPFDDISRWSTNQIICFLDTLLDGPKLGLKTIGSINKMYKFSSSKNSEILFRYSRLAIVAVDKTVLPIVVKFITTQGRMKYVRPLYRLLFEVEMGRSLAVETFMANRDFYHPICAKMIASDLKRSESKRMFREKDSNRREIDVEPGTSQANRQFFPKIELENAMVSGAVATVAVALAFLALLRKKSDL